MIEELEQKLEELFKSQGLEKCVERWKATRKHVARTEEDYIEDLKTRLRQGGVL
jgi:hypothetical protein